MTSPTTSAPNATPHQRVSILGGSGYVGGELLRLLLRHPNVEVVDVTSERSAGKLIRTLHPQLRGWTDKRFVSKDDLGDCDLLISALPHGAFAGDIERYAGQAARIIDCSADFRIDDKDVYETAYGDRHAAPSWLPRFVYGLPEANRSAIAGSSYVSGVGCNATASNLALLPFVRSGLLDEDRPVIVDLKVGSSEAGRSASSASHHPERSGVVRSFSPTGHRHVHEVRQVTGIEEVDLTVTSVELVRGVLATAHLWLAPGTTERDIWGAMRESYGSDPFVRVVHDKGGAYRHPEPRLVTGTNHADVGWSLSADGRRVVALCAIDNLMKGAAGTAVQCLNLMCGFDERTALESIGIYPL